MDNKQKIFGIGFGKTGTSSLFNAMLILDYKARHGIKDINDIVNFEFVDDISISCRFKFLDYMYPKSKFILTTRDLDSWLKSIKNYFKRKNITKKHPKGDLRKLETRFILFGTIIFEEDKYIKTYNDFHVKVYQYFRKEKNRLLIMNIIEGDSWKKLCKFLGKSIPNKPFPYANKRKY